MKKVIAPAIPLAWTCILSPALRFIPQTRLWSPMPWRLGSMFGVPSPVALLLAVALSVWAAALGFEVVKRAGAVALPIMLLTLAVALVCLMTVGLKPSFLPLAGMVTVIADILLMSTVFSGLFALLKKGRKNWKKGVDKTGS